MDASAVSVGAASVPVTEVSFYHLQRAGLDRALPKLLEKVLERRKRALLVAGSEDRVAAINATLWTFDPASFLPHGSKADGFASEQPVFLTADAGENPNGAQVLVLVDGAASGDLGRFERVLDIVDGKDPDAVADARERWQALTAAGHALTYWQQTEAGGWEKRG